ncbi:toxin-antitoxin system YwqK family antitoxin [Gaetbulibacter aestuarii]|uniref:MORN repeat protein n=1 Tax=Gaetbulibacter aestuarii TaxID=1502358 RepID=A0ABW7MUQ2_9FLAO
MRIIIILLIFSCQSLIGQEDAFPYISDNNLYGELVNGIPEKDTIVEFKKNGILLGRGALAVSKYGVSDLRVGYWKEYSKNGTLKMEGKYKLGSYISCCVGGECRSFYYYRIGLWKIYDNNGELKYELTYEPTKLHIDTTCMGGDNLIFGIIKEVPIKYRNELTSDKIFELQRVNNLTPLNGQIFID